MDKFVTRGAPSKKPDDKKRKSQAEKDRVYEIKRKRGFQKHWFDDFPWLHSENESSNAYCHVCRLFPQLSDNTSPLFVGKEISRRDTLIAHQNSAKHAACQLKLTERNTTVKGDLDRAFAKVEQAELDRYKKLFNTAYAIAKRGKPFTDYTFLCEVQIKNGLYLGSDHLGRDACTDFIKTMSDVLLEKVQTQVTKNVRFVSVMADSSTDSSVADQEAILLRYVNPETSQPVTNFCSIEKLEHATSQGVYNAIKTGLANCGIDLEKMDQIQSKLICVNMDGAAVNMGARNGVAKKLNDSVENQVFVTHCVAHKLELGILDAVKDIQYLKSFEDTLKRICKFYSFSPKRKNEVQHLTKVLDETFIMHTEIKAVRWVASKTRALRAVCLDLHVTLTHMQHILSISNRADELGQARAIQNDLTQAKFVKYINLMLDILTAVTSTSQLFQTKDLLVFEVKEGIDVLYSKLLAMNEQPGENLERFYSQYDQETKTFAEKIKLKGSVAKFEEDADIHCLLEKVSKYILDRFADLDQPPHSFFRIFDFRVWPTSLTQLSTFGNCEIKQLCQLLCDGHILSPEEAKEIPSEWQMFKVHVSKQRHSRPSSVFQSVLQRRDDSVKNICILVELLLTISTSSAACERLFSQMNLLKNPLRSRLTQENLQHQMRVVANGVSFEEFDPAESVQYWLKSGHRHIKHKKPGNQEPSTSTAVE